MPRHRRLAARPRRSIAGLGVGALCTALCTALLLTPGTAGAYTASITNSSNTAGSAVSASYFTCDAAWAADQATAYYTYTLSQPSNSTKAPDTSVNGTGNGNGNGTGNRDGSYLGSMVSSPDVPKACPRDPGGSYVLNGSTSYVSTPLALANPSTFSTAVWFRTRAAGGRIIGFGDAQTGASVRYDRHVYIDTTGRLVFGTFTDQGVRQTVTSPGTVTDDAWHHVVATMSPTAGMTLWLDGKQVASNAGFRSAQAYTGYWRIGFDNLDTWPLAGSRHFTGRMRYAAVYTSVLTPTQIQNHYTAGR